MDNSAVEVIDGEEAGHTAVQAAGGGSGEEGLVRPLAGLAREAGMAGGTKREEGRGGKHNRRVERWDPWEKEEKPRRRQRAIEEAIDRQLRRQMEQRDFALWEAGWVLPESVHAWQSM